jgi:hypothetical protein
MDDLEREIWAWVDDAVTDVEPVTAEEVLTDDAGPPGGPGAVRRALTVVLVVVAAAVGGFEVFVPHNSEPADSIQTGPETVTTLRGADGWEAYTEPRLGWTLERPVASRFQAWHGRCRVNDSGTLITNQDRNVQWTPERVGCSTAFLPADLAQQGFVGLRISHHEGRPPPGTEPALDDTPSGITLADLEPAGDVGDGPGPAPVETSTLRVVIGGDARYSVTTWIADGAEPGDVADLERMVASISWAEPDADQGAEYTNATGNPRTSAFLACMVDREYAPELALDAQGTIDGELSAQVTWDPSDRADPGFAYDRAACEKRAATAADRLTADFTPWSHTEGASQPASEAERDGVVPAVARLALAERAVPLRWTETRQGVWAITRMASDPGRTSDADGCLGDRSGRYGTDYVCAREYGEIVLVDPEDGSVRRSYPLPGLYPVWMHITNGAVYAGRVGDGAMPDSMIMRIDRQSFEAETIVFPSDAAAVDPADLGRVDVEAMGWITASPEARIQDLVGAPGLPGGGSSPAAAATLTGTAGDDGALPRPAGVLVDSTIGITLVDLAAVDALFA